MKIIFDNEVQKLMLMRALGKSSDFCPSDFGLTDCDLINRDCSMTCDECWANCGIEMEVSESSEDVEE